jgi:hypothetical protein
MNLRRTPISDLRNEMAITARLIQGLKRDKREARSVEGKQSIQDKLDTLREHAAAVSDEIICRENVFNN